MGKVKNTPYKDEVSKDYGFRLDGAQYVSNGYYLHYHRNMEIYGVVNGEVLVNILGETNTLKNGQIAIVDGLELHSYTMTNETHEAEVFHVHIGAGYLISSLFFFYPGKKLPRWLLDEDINKPIYEKLKVLFSLGNTISAIKKNGLVCDVFSDIIDNYGIFDYSSENFKIDNSKALMDNEIINIVQYIYDHYREELSINSLSKIFCISPSTMAKKLSKAINIDFRTFVNEVRAQKVIQMQADPKNKDMKLFDIISYCGFNSPATFYRSYKNYFNSQNNDK